MVWVQDHTASGVEAGMAVLVLVYDGTTSSIGRTKMGNEGNERDGDRWQPEGKVEGRNRDEGRGERQGRR
jgi:hypothetical protein